MFLIPKPTQADKDAKSVDAPVHLKSSHLYISADLCAELFGDDLNAYAAYYADRGVLMIAGVSDELFKKLHKATQHMLKGRKQTGDKTIALHEMIIDNEIDPTDRVLEYKFEKALGVLTVHMS